MNQASAALVALLRREPPRAVQLIYLSLLIRLGVKALWVPYEEDL